MSYNIAFRRQAKQDIFTTYRWYQQKRPGLGEDFLQAVDSSLALIAEHPESYQVIYKNVRRALLPRFPYSLLYVISAQTIKVIACFHLKRDPQEWHNRI